MGEAHLLLGDSTGAAAAYVGMTRGRVRNIAHLVADSPKTPTPMGRGVRAATAPTSGRVTRPRSAADDIDRYGPRVDTHALALQAAALRDQRHGVPSDPHLSYPSAPGRSAPSIGR